MLRLLMKSLLGVTLCAASAPAQDVASGRDHPLVGRYDGSRMTRYLRRDFEEQRILTKPITAADRQATGRRINANNSVAADGVSFRIRYSGPAGRSALEVTRNFEQSVQAKGFELLFRCRAAECSNLGGSDLYLALNDESPMGRADMGSNPSSQVFSTAVLRRPEGNVYLAVYTAEISGRPETLLDIVETAAMETGRIRFVDAAQMKREIDSSGRVALYGILFDFDKATITAESRPTLEEIARFLKSEPALAVVVTGHTDAKGAFDYNLDLSRRRAAAVVEVLTRQYGIAAGRLTPFGAGMAAPVASNDDEKGRTLNRRVELVKR